MACSFATSGAELPSDHPPVPNGPPQVQEIPIPQPPPSFLLGNIPDMEPDFPARGIQRVANLYGEIVQLQLASRAIVLSSQELINEACDQDRFHKDVSRTLHEVRALAGDGLFTSAHEDGRLMKREENWWKAHRLLVPAFGPLGALLCGASATVWVLTFCRTQEVIRRHVRYFVTNGCAMLPLSSHLL